MTPRRSSRAWALLAACLGVATAWGLEGLAADGPRMPGPAPRRHPLADAAAQNAACERCHTDVAAEWRGSYHQLAQRDPFYERAFAREPLAFCQSCHAPEADPSRPVPPALASMGVGCVTCHVTGPGVVLAAPRGGGDGPPAPHPVTRDARFGDERACAGCHEFRFPEVAAGAPRALMQATAREHAASPNRDVPCASCHMPERGEGERRHRSHAFAGGHDPALVRSAASAVATRTGPASVRVTITPSPALGHAFPTGDLFRRLEVAAEARDGGARVAEARRYLARRFADARPPNGLGGVVRREVADDRPLDAPVAVDLALDARASGHPVAWRVVYQRVEHPRSDRPDESAVGDSIVIAEGTLPP